MLKITNVSAFREITAYLGLLTIFWGAILLLTELEEFYGLYNQEWIQSWHRDSIYYVAMFFAVLVANRIGSVSFMGIALVVLSGVSGVIATLMFLDSVGAESFTIGPWYAFLVPSVVACVFLFIARQLTKRSNSFRRYAPPPDG